MKSLEEKKKEILRNPPKELMGKGLKSFDTIDYAKWISQLNALDKPSKLTKEEFHHILSEFPPSIAEDSGQPEWTTGEIDKVWNFITGKCKYILYDRWERKPRIDEGINILIYKLRKNYREFGFDYYGIAKTLEISLWFFNVIVMWGNEEGLNDKFR